MADRRPDRAMGPNHDTFWEYCTQGEFRLQRCDRCGTVQFPPVALCSECLSEAMTWTKMQGTGTVLSHCTFMRQYYPECPVPWHALLVELDEGPSLIGTPTDMSIPEEDMKVGTRVRVVLQDVEDSHGPFKIPAWVKDEARTGTKGA